MISFLPRILTHEWKIVHQRIWGNVCVNLLSEKTDYKTIYHMVYIVKKRGRIGTIVSVILGGRKMATL